MFRFILAMTNFKLRLARSFAPDELFTRITVGVVLHHDRDAVIQERSLERCK